MISIRIQNEMNQFQDMTINFYGVFCLITDWPSAEQDQTNKRKNRETAEVPLIDSDMQEHT